MRIKFEAHFVFVSINAFRFSQPSRFVLRDLRFCTTEGIENVIPLSDFRFSDFDENYGVRMADGPLAGLLARSVVVIGKDGKIAYTELVPEITQEPDYDKAIAAVK